MYKTLFLSLVLFCCCLKLYGQGMTPAQQAKVDSLMRYVNKQLQEGKVPDQKYIDSSNAVIRSMNVAPICKDSLGIIATDSVKQITRQSMAGSSFTVPSGKIWRVKSIYVTDGGSYNILVTSIKFDKSFSEGEKIFTPSWTAEAELLSGDKSSFTYIFKIEESDSKK